MTLAEPLQITQRIAREFERLRIRYLVGGSLASSLHGIPRATQDVDIVADICDEHIPSLVETFKADFYLDAEMIKEAIHHQASFNLIHLATMFKVDIFVLKPDAASQQEMARRCQYQVSSSAEDTLFLASAEDIIAHKLHWFDLGGCVSERQWKDVLGVLQVQQDHLDRNYLKQAAEQRNVSHLLDRALEESRL